MINRKIILIILDGIGDLPIAKLGNKTPLGAAGKPNLNALAARAKLGLMQPIKGIAPESGAAQYAILGYPLSKCPRRGPLEALGIGYKLKKGEIAIRCNFARAREKKIVDVRMKIPPRGIIKKLNRIDPEIRIIPTIDYRAVMIVKNASDNVSNTHPGYEKYGSISRAVTRTKIERICRGDRETCKRINKLIANAEKIMHNGTILLRDAGKKPTNVKKMRNWSIIADMPVEIGLGKFLGMKVIKRGKDEVRQIVNCRTNIYVQIKGPDKPAHKGDFKGKAMAIERIDRLLAPLKKEKNALICITADHSTPCALKRHSADPVPVLISGAGIRGDGIGEFSESACKRGSIGRIEGRQLMRTLYAFAS